MRYNLQYGMTGCLQLEACALDHSPRPPHPMLHRLKRRDVMLRERCYMPLTNVGCRLQSMQS